MAAATDVLPTLHPKPAPATLSPKVVKCIIPEACLDTGWEDLYDDDPQRLLAAFEEVSENIAYVEVLMSGELTEAWAVIRTQKLLGEEYDRTAEELGRELLWMEEFEGEWDKERKKRARRTIRRLRKRAKRLTEARRECDRYWKQYREYVRDGEAVERLGAGGGED